MSTAFFWPFLSAMAPPKMYAQHTFSKQMGWISFTIL